MKRTIFDIWRRHDVRRAERRVGELCHIDPCTGREIDNGGVLGRIAGVELQAGKVVYVVDEWQGNRTWWVDA